jgi:hypothetical protein
VSPSVSAAGRIASWIRVGRLAQLGDVRGLQLDVDRVAHPEQRGGEGELFRAGDLGRRLAPALLHLLGCERPQISREQLDAHLPEMAAGRGAAHTGRSVAGLGGVLPDRGLDVLDQRRFEIRILDLEIPLHAQGGRLELAYDIGGHVHRCPLWHGEARRDVIALDRREEAVLNVPHPDQGNRHHQQRHTNRQRCVALLQCALECRPVAALSEALQTGGEDRLHALPAR